MYWSQTESNKWSCNCMSNQLGHPFRSMLCALQSSAREPCTSSGSPQDVLCTDHRVPGAGQASLLFQFTLSNVLLYLTRTHSPTNSRSSQPRGWLEGWLESPPPAAHLHVSDAALPPPTLVRLIDLDVPLAVLLERLELLLPHQTLGLRHRLQRREDARHHPL